MKYYHQLDREGFYCFSFIPDESPREPGVYLIPAGCVDITPPEFDKEKQIPKFTDQGWVLVEIKKPKKSLLQRLKDKIR